DHFTTLAMLTRKTSDTRRQLDPAKTAATTRSRRSREYARAIDAGLLSSQHLESQFSPVRNPPPDSTPTNQTLGPESYHRNGRLGSPPSRFIHRPLDEAWS